MHRIVRFGVFEIDLERRELRRSGLRVRLQDQPFQLLVALLERPGEIVTREHLRNKLWPADTFVDFDHSLNAAVKRLRDSLGDTADTPRLVETVARRGYRFVGSVEIPQLASSDHGGARLQRLRTRGAVLVGAAAAAAVILTVFFIHHSSSKAAEPILIPAVTTVGEKYTPNLSPDGQHLAFAWNGGSGAHFSLYVKVVGTEESLRLTKQESIDFDPVWSPDGRYIAFCRIQTGEAGIYIISSLGGAERRVRNTLWPEQTFDQVIWSAGRLSWSPDGKSIAFADRASANESPSIFLLSLDSQDLRRLTSPGSSRGDSNPAFSPDGRTVAFTRASQAFQAIFTVPVSGGKEQQVISDGSDHWGLAWTPDGKGIVFANAGWPLNAGWIWKVSPRGGEPERLQFGQEGIQPSIRGNRLVYVRQSANLNIWKRKLNSSHTASSADRLISSTRMESGPQFSPDGSKIVFESTRSGAYEVWMCRSDGSGLVQLSHFNSVTGTPRWSPDGRQIAFDSRVTGDAEIYLIDSEGGSPRRFTKAGSNEVVPSWSRDGRWLYFASDRTGGWQVWKAPLEGGTAVQVTRHGGFAAFESPDGRFLYYAKGLSVPGIWRVPTAGGEEVEMIGSPQAGYWGFWALVENGIYYLDSATKPAIMFYDLSTHRPARVFDMGNTPTPQAPALAVSPDGGTILYTELDELNSDIILVENFR